MTTTDVVPTLEHYLEQVTEIEPVLREHDEANERERRLVGPVVDALRDAGMFRIGVPRHYGGASLDPRDACRVVAALAEIDSAAAWNVSIAAAATGIAGIFSPDLTDTIFGDDPDAVCAVSTAAPAFVTEADDTYVVNGELKFLSGAHQASWFLSIAAILRDGQLVTDASGQMPAIHLACLKRDEVELLDRWHVSAMRGTGSTDASVSAAVIPPSRLVRVEHLRPGGCFSDPGFQIAPWNGIAMETAVSVGIARAAIHDLQALATTKIAAGMDMNKIAQRERVQHNLARAMALVEGAWAYLTVSLSFALEHASEVGGPLPSELKAALQLSAFTGADASARAVDLVCEAAGTSSARLEHRFERYHRDVHFLTKHASKSVERVTNVGKMLLGMPAGWPTLDL
ncbi:MAG: acyl-CoA dehydrogenase family protein [Actinomycetota bacterium]